MRSVNARQIAERRERVRSFDGLHSAVGIRWFSFDSWGSTVRIPLESFDIVRYGRPHYERASECIHCTGCCSEWSTRLVKARSGHLTLREVAERSPLIYEFGAFVAFDTMSLRQPDTVMVVVRSLYGNFFAKALEQLCTAMFEINSWLRIAFGLPFRICSNDNRGV